jgi:hypothetical protein
MKNKSRLRFYGLLGAFAITCIVGCGRSEFVLKDIKPTLSGYTNNAYVTTDTVGQDKMKMTVFTTNKEVKSPLMAVKGGIVWGNVSYGLNSDGSSGILHDTNGVMMFEDGAYVAIDGDSQFTGNLDYDGSIYTFSGTVRLLKHVFTSDEKDPLVFKLVKDKGLVYLKGKGKVALPDGKVLTTPTSDK